MTRTEIIFTFINLIVAIIVGFSQIYIAKKVKDFKTGACENAIRLYMDKMRKAVKTIK